MTQIRIDVTAQELQQLQAMANRMGAPSVANAVKRVVFQAARIPQPMAQIISDVFKEIDALPAGAEFTTGEILRSLYADTNFVYAEESHRAVPSTVAATVGRSLAAQANMSAHGYVIDRVVSRTNVFRKIA